MTEHPAETGGLRPGERAPEFYLPPERQIAITLYERYCGRPLVLLLAESVAGLAGFRPAGIAAGMLGLVAGPPGGTLPAAAMPVMMDDGRLRHALVGTGFDPGTGAAALVFDAQLRLAVTINPADMAAIEGAIRNLHDPPTIRMVEATAPVLLVPQVFDSGLCERLIAVHDSDAVPSGMVRVRDGAMTLEVDPTVKARLDHALVDPDLTEAVMAALRRNLLPGIAQAFRFNVERLEGFKVTAYDAASGGYFRPHRDNMTTATAHRQFAVSVNLNAGYAGGTLRFPEFDRSEYRPPAGAAIAFSGSLLHEVTPVTSGRRYVLLTFAW